MDTWGDEYREAMHHFTRALFRAGVGLGLTPIYMLPKASQQQLKEAGQDLTSGLAKLARSLAHTIDAMEK